MLDRDQMRVCPYDPAHNIRSSRYEIHLLKCSKNFGFTIEQCPFNAKHQFKRSELRTHLQQCPDRHRLGHEQEINETIEKPQPIILDPSVHSSNDKVNVDSTPVVGWEDDWESEINQVPIIQPLNYGAPSYQSYTRLRPAERKQHRMDMVKKVQESQENGIKKQ